MVRLLESENGGMGSARERELGFQTVKESSLTYELACDLRSRSLS